MPLKLAWDRPALETSLVESLGQAHSSDVPFQNVWDRPVLGHALQIIGTRLFLGQAL